MKFLIPLLLIPLLLLGCASQPDAVPSASATVPTAAVDESPAASTLTPEIQDGITVYPLPFGSVQGIHAAGDCILVFSGDGISTSVTQFSGDPLQTDVSMTLPNVVDPAQIRFSENSLFFSVSHTRKIC